jgi:hypothetical protein
MTKNKAKAAKKNRKPKKNKQKVYASLKLTYEHLNALAKQAYETRQEASLDKK